MRITVMVLIKSLRRTLFYLTPALIAGFIYRLATGSIFHPRHFINSRVCKGSYVDTTVQILGWGKVSVGEYSVISEKCFFVSNFRDSDIGEIRIGNNCHIGRNNFFSCGPEIILGDYVFTGGDCKLLGCGHNIESPLIPYVASGLDAGGRINIGTNCWLATGVVVLYNVNIGRGSVVGAGSVVTNDIPEFTSGFGVPFVATKRYNFREGKWVNISDWRVEYEKFFPSETDYLAHLRKVEPSVVPALTSASSKFGWLK